MSPSSVPEILGSQIAPSFDHGGFASLRGWERHHVFGLRRADGAVLDQHGGVQRFLPRAVLVVSIPENANDDQHHGDRGHRPSDHLLAMLGNVFDAVLDFQSEFVALQFLAGKLVHGDLVTAGNFSLT